MLNIWKSRGLCIDFKLRFLIATVFSLCIDFKLRFLIATVFSIATDGCESRAPTKNDN